MSNAKTIAKNTTFLFLSQTSDKILSFFLIVLITRHLGDLGFGIYSFAFAFISLFVAISNLGMNLYIFREISKVKDKAKNLLDNFISIRLTTILVLYTILGIASWYMPKTKEIMLTIFLVMLHELFAALNSLINIVMQSHERNEYTLYTTLIDKGLALVIGGTVLFMGYSINALILSLVVAKIFSFTYYYYICRSRFLRISFGKDFAQWKGLLRNSLPFGMTMIFGMIYYRVDKIMLTMMDSYQATGLYSAGSKLIDALAFIPTVIVLATFPAMSSFHHNQSKDKSQLLYNKSMYYLFIIALPLTIGISMLSESITLLVYKKEFIQSALVLQILSWSLIFIFANYCMGYLLNSINKQHLFTVSTGICATANIILNYIFILDYSYIGATVATLVTQVANSVMLFYFCAREGFAINVFNLVYKPAVAGAFMAILIYYARDYNLLLLAPLAAILYFGVLLLLKGLGKEEINLIKSVFSKT